MAISDRIDITANLLVNVSNAEQGINKLKSSLSQLKLPANLDSNFKKSFANLDNIFARYRTQFEKGFSTKADAANFGKIGKELDAELGKISKYFTELSGKQVDFKVKTDELINAEKELQRVVDLKEQLSKQTLSLQIEGKANSFKDLEATLQKIKDIAGDTRSGRAAGDALNFLNEGKITQALNKLKEVQKTIGNLGKDKTLDLTKEFGPMPNLINNIINAVSGMKAQFDSADASINKATTDINNVRLDQFNKAANDLEKFSNEFEEIRGATSAANGSLQEYANSTARFNEELKGLKTSTQYFFSLRNMFNLLKSGLREAVDTVKELDKVMTQTAVVTKFDVGDMWEKLPEYTKHANELGATVQDMYESTTLYYQQGLNTQQAMGVATETMKMARIAGMDAAEATDMMTAALRGFNMEITNASAEHINDVYSNLAAKTASNTEELGTAMQRTASIAASAGMSFEGTAAFLAQAIETTREPAENLGTAMKTIVARFTELKKNPLDIVEVDGEEVSYNKIDTALQSIGVSLKDANGQFRDLDKVFLDISKRWDSLTQTQQRYIATTAAGSRQQSRFIAMMSNYERTVELMDYANNSSGASTEQFNKTLDSLEAKINKFQNAWKQFLMNIMNDSWIKGIVDFGTKAFDTINNIIDALSLGNKTVKSGLSLFTAFLGLRTGGKLINNAIGGIGNMLDPNAKGGFLKGFFGGGGAAGAQAARTQQTIVNPIVSKIGEVVAAINRTNSQTKQQNGISGTAKNSYSQAKQNFNDLLSQGSFKVSDVKKQLKGLNDAEQYALIKSSPAMAKSLQASFNNTIKTAGLSQEAQTAGLEMMKSLQKGMLRGRINFEDYLNLGKSPEKWGEIFGDRYSQGIYDEIKEKFSAQKQQKEIADRISQTQKASGGFLSNEAAAAMSKYANQKVTEKEQEVQSQQLPKLARGFETVGSKATGAGMAIQAFGNILNNLGLGAFGGIFTSIGSGIASIGMAISGLGPIIDSIKEKGILNSLKGLGPLGIAATGAGIALAVVSIWKMVKSHQEKVAREAGEAARQAYEDGYVKRGETITSLKSYEPSFNELSRGIDKYNNNVSLTDEEYEEYLNLSKEIAEIAPELIAGYDKEGRAILKKGDALKEVIALEEEEQKTAAKTYANANTADKLIGEFEVSDIYKKYAKKSTTAAAGWSFLNSFVPSEKTNEYFGKEKDKLGKILTKYSLGDDFKKAFTDLSGIELKSVQDLSASGLAFLNKHSTDVINSVKRNNKDITEAQLQDLEDSVNTITSAYGEFMEEASPIVDSFRMWMGQEGLDAIGLNLGEEFVNSFNDGVEGVISSGLLSGKHGAEIHQDLQDYSDLWEKMGGDTSEYSRLMKEATIAQEDYINKIGQTGAIEEYQNEIESTAVKLEQLGDAWKTQGAAGQAFAEQCYEQANALRNYATEGVVSLEESLNTLSDEFKSARGAKERFDKATEGGDYYTAAEGYKGIIETVLDDKNKAGLGSLTGWAGAEELLGKEFVDSHSWDQVVSQIEKVQKCFEDGSDGVLAFNDLLVENASELEGFGRLVGENDFQIDFQNEDLAEFAEKLGLSEEALAALIDKARQWVPIDLSNPDKTRAALEQSQGSMTGTATNGDNVLYINESNFREQAYRQGIRGKNYTNTRDNLSETQGVRFLTVENLTAKYNKDGSYANQVLENVGLKGADKNLENAVKVFSNFGFTLEETKDILSNGGVKLAEGEVTAEQVEEEYRGQAYEIENPVISDIAGNTGVIANAATALLASMGILTQESKEKIEESTSEETVSGLLKKLKLGTDNFEDSTSRNAAVQEVQGQIDSYNETIGLLQKSGNESLQPYIDKLIEARKELQEGLDQEEQEWATTISNAANSKILEGVGTKAELPILEQRSFDIKQIFNQEDIMQAAEALRQLEEEEDLSYNTMLQLAQSFLQFREADVGNLNLEQFDNLCSKLGIASSEYTELLKLVQTPFVLEGRLQGDDLTNYIKEYEGLTDSEKTIFLRTDISGEEKVSILLEEINNEFGDGSEETKSIIIQAEAKLANGDEAGAKQLLIENGFNEDEAEEITKKLLITVDGSVANLDQVRTALESEIKGLKLNPTVKARVNAKVSTELSQIGKNTQTIKYKTKVDDKQLQNVKKDASTEVYMPLEVEDKASSKISSIHSAARKSETFNVSPTFTGDWHKDLYITKHIEKDAHGRNYIIPARQFLTFGSAAGGMNVPKFKKSTKSQITALVGEEGFEVGYIPSENRSVIFGANGPEMTSFPKDTIIYPHDQSKEILRRGKKDHATLGSFQAGTDSARSEGGLGSAVRGNSGDDVVKEVKKTTKKVGKTTDKITNNSNDNNEKITQATGKINAFWENIERQTSSINRKIEENSRNFENAIKNFNKTSKDAQSIFNKYNKYTNIQKGYYEDEVQQAKKERRKLRRKDNTIKISYEKKVKKDGKEKKETKNVDVKSRKFLKFDDKAKVWILNEAELKKVANDPKQGKNKAKAIRDELAKQLADTYTKQYKAEDEILKLDEKRQEMANKMYKTFLGWEKSINKIYVISKKIEDIESKRNRYKAQKDLEYARVEAGALSLGVAEKRIKQLAKQDRKEAVQGLQARRQDTTAKRRRLAELYGMGDAYDTFEKAKKAGWVVGEGSDAENDYEAKRTAYNILKRTTKNKDGTYNMAVAYKKLNDSGIIGEKYDAIKKVLDDIYDAQKDYQDAIIAETEAITELYNQYNDANEALLEARDDLLEDVDETSEQEINKLEELNNSISKAFKELIDEVKNRLTERRNTEDNEDTEKEISKKQQRLAMLQADTAGGHAVEIQKLQEELAKSQKDYQRKREDQLLDRLTKQGDEAQKQREKQINLLQQNKEIASTTGQNVEEVTKWVKNPNKYKDSIESYWMAANRDKYKTDEEAKQAFNTWFLKLVENSVIYKQAKKAINSKTVENANKETRGLNYNNGKPTEDITAKDIREFRKNKGSINNALEQARGNTKLLKEGGYTLKEFKEGGLTGKQALEAGWTPSQIFKAGYTTAKDLKAAKDLGLIKTAKQALGVGYTGKDVQKIFGTSTKSIANIVKKNSNRKTIANEGGGASGGSAGGRIQSNNINAKDMAGLTDKAGYTYNKTGTKRTKVEGTTVYIKGGIDSKDNTAKKIDITEATTAQFKSNKQLFTKALINAIKTLKPGTKISRHAADFVKIGGLKGKKVSVKGAKGDARLSSDGMVHYQQGNTGVRIWDLNKDGSNTLYDFQKSKNEETIKRFLKDKEVGSVWKELNENRKKENKKNENSYKKALADWKKNKKGKKPTQEKALKTFASGGLANFTGPAWLDGTSSKPELVLNAQDTKNFIMLKDVLSGFIGNISTLAGRYAHGAGSTFEININVDKITSDYDVDKMAERVKKIIVKDASYRNVTQVRNFR